MKAQNIKWTPVTEAMPDSPRLVLVTVAEEGGVERIAVGQCGRNVWNGEYRWDFPGIYGCKERAVGISEPEEKVVAWAYIKPYEN